MLNNTNDYSALVHSRGVSDVSARKLVDRYKLWRHNSQT